MKKQTIHWDLDNIPSDCLLSTYNHIYSPNKSDVFITSNPEKLGFNNSPIQILLTKDEYIGDAYIVSNYEQIKEILFFNQKYNLSEI